jgi:hypothetical protein
MKEITIEELVKIRDNSKCLSCGSKALKLGMYPHSDGVYVEGKDLPQWVYFHCKRCEYDNALWKINRRKEVIPEVGVVV